MTILPFDCESFPNWSLTWGTYDQTVIKVMKRRMICSIAWLSYPNGKVQTMALPDFKGYTPEKWTNREMMRCFKNDILNKQDIVIAHNVDEFDDKMVNSDLFLNKLGSPRDHRTIDTLKILRARMRLNSNRLGDVCEELGIGKKLKNPGIEMWIGCMRGDRESWKQMRSYNAHDVNPLLVGLYEHVRPWIRNHPNLCVDQAVACCPACKCTKLSSDGWRYTQTCGYIRMICKSCFFRFRKVPIGKSGKFTYRP